MEHSSAPSALIVDDESIILIHACDILEEAGFKCANAADAPSAIALLDRHANSVVLLFSDVEMPGEMNGLALARHVDRHWPHIEIVLASGRIRPQPGDMPDRATFITKPFTTEMVHQHLRMKLPDDKQPGPLKQAI
ncbi:response regulator [Sphingobium sp. B11D3A]|uniref:response regulator n=1 Tax=Sphingobium sp. B11D3A TaxID=2940574 RepID=UPI0022250029|nr:response regulator [Sphingobium sp. B11D3A]MCW2390983.1 CheY-like chemotaxis protein [Sphingobium sp. B11D3A]